MTICPEGMKSPPTCWTWELPCRYLKSHGGWHFHLCKIGEKLRTRST